MTTILFIASLVCIVGMTAAAERGFKTGVTRRSVIQLAIWAIAAGTAVFALVVVAPDPEPTCDCHPVPERTNP